MVSCNHTYSKNAISCAVVEAQTCFLSHHLPGDETSAHNKHLLWLYEGDVVLRQGTLLYDGAAFVTNTMVYVGGMAWPPFDWSLKRIHAALYYYSLN